MQGIIFERAPVLVLLLLLSGCVSLGIGGSLTDGDPRDSRSAKEQGEAGQCVDTLYSDNLRCPSGQFVTEEGCDDSKVKCGTACFDVSFGTSRCKNGSVVSTDSCALGQARCIPTECSPESGGKKLSCTPGQDLTNDGCPDGFVQCAPW